MHKKDLKPPTALSPRPGARKGSKEEKIKEVNKFSCRLARRQNPIGEKEGGGKRPPEEKP